jgi:6-phosphofructokinase 1
LGDVHLGHLVAKMTMKRLEERKMPKVKVNGVQLGYESRCAPPHAYDVMLGSTLGVGAYVALAEKGLDGHMVSTVGQLDHCFVPFSELIDPKTLITEVRYIDVNSDFHKLAMMLSDDMGEKV